MKIFRILAVAIFTMTLLFGNSNIVLAEKNDISALGECSVQKKYTMYLGTNDKDTMQQEIPSEKIREEMDKICMKYVDGYTVTTADGYYRGKDNEVFHETSFVYVFIGTDIYALQKIMDEALVKFNQESILLEESDTKSIFYEGKMIQ